MGTRIAHDEPPLQIDQTRAQLQCLRAPPFAT
jgi:hypothetical protein